MPKYIRCISSCSVVVLVANAALELGQDRDVVRVPLAECGAHLDLLAVGDVHLGTHRNGVAVDLAVAVVEQAHLAVTVEHDELTRRVLDHPQVGEAHLARALGLAVGLLDGTACRTPARRSTGRR